MSFIFFLKYVFILITNCVPEIKWQKASIFTPNAPTQVFPPQEMKLSNITSEKD